jgi:hypothetical protein
MSTPHRATREEREMLELRTRLDCLERRCEVQLQQLSDLQDRHRRLAGSVRLLEREVVVDRPEPAPLATDQELYQLYDRTGPTIVDAFRAIYDLGRQHGAARPAPPPPEPPPAPPWWGDGQPAAPAGSLVDEVAECITPSGEPLRRGWACDAITSAADWLEKRGNIGSAEDLRKEAAAWLEAELET